MENYPRQKVRNEGRKEKESEMKTFQTITLKEVSTSILKQNVSLKDLFQIDGKLSQAEGQK